MSHKLAIIIIIGVVLIVMVGGIIWMWSETITPPANNTNTTVDNIQSSNVNNANTAVTNTTTSSANDSTTAIDAELGNVNMGDVDQEFININADINQL